MALKNYTPNELSARGIDPARFCGHYSDAGFMIRKIGTQEIYSEAIDLLPCLYRYEKTEILVKKQHGQDDDRS